MCHTNVNTVTEIFISKCTELVECNMTAMSVGSDRDGLQSGSICRTSVEETEGS